MTLLVKTLTTKSDIYVQNICMLLSNVDNFTLLDDAVHMWTPITQEFLTLLRLHFHSCISLRDFGLEFYLLTIEYSSNIVFLARICRGGRSNRNIQMFPSYSDLFSFFQFMDTEDNWRPLFSSFMDLFLYVSDFIYWNNE